MKKHREPKDSKLNREKMALGVVKKGLFLDKNYLKESKEKLKALLEENGFKFPSKG